ncbi:16S rRNA (guanine(527)-N(7))-methyltransferase RsmG, partial [Streptococcus pyogenes]
MTPQEFYHTLEEDGFPLTTKQKEQFDTYFKLL